MNFQEIVGHWVVACFGEEIANDKIERNHRFVEEALELAQACGANRQDCHELVDYVFKREIGEREQEVGGVMVTLAALCNAQGLDMNLSGYHEISRCFTKVKEIRAKQKRKPKLGPLPGRTAS